MSDFISLANAKKFVEEFISAQPKSTYAWTFDKADIQESLRGKKCRKMRVYLGINDQKVITPILVPVRKNDDDILSGDIIDFASPCPPVCGNVTILD